MLKLGHGKAWKVVRHWAKPSGPRNPKAVKDILELLVFAGIVIVGQFSPGPDMVLLTRTALRDGRMAGLKMAAGIASGLAVHSTIAVGGMSVAFQRFPVMRLVLQWLAAIYLLWLARAMWVDSYRVWKHGAVRRDVPGDGRHTPFVRGLLCNLFNPKVVLFLAAVCAPFLLGERPGWWPAAIWSVVVGLGIGLWSLWVLLLQWQPLRSRYELATVWIDGFFGLALTALAVRLMIGW